MDTNELPVPLRIFPPTDHPPNNALSSLLPFSSTDQVRTRVFNMIAEYRRILKNPTPERIKKCVFFQALHKIYQAKDTNGLENVMMNYGDYSEQYNFDPIDFSNAEENGDCNGEDNSDEEDRSEMFAYSMSPNSFTGNLNDHNSNGWCYLLSLAVSFAHLFALLPSR